MTTQQTETETETETEHLGHNVFNWFPGHMVKASKDIKNTKKLVNIIIEVRDARVPLASGNKCNYDNDGDKPYLIVFNKTNLADPKAVELWKAWFTEQKESFIFVNALEQNAIKAIIKRSREIVHAHRIKSNSDVKERNEITMMVLGLPNTGKSTIINKIANRNATKAAAKPGQTKMKLWINAGKHIKILDTPGVMPMKIKEQIHSMWLSAIHAIPDHIITPDYSACFVVEHLLKTRSSAFKEHYKFESLDIDLITACDHIGKIRGCVTKGGSYDYDHIYNIILKDFRRGSLGVTSFELPPVK